MAIIFDTILEELLHEVAADPKSCLLRGPRKRTYSGLYETSEAVSENSTWLTLPERYLVQYYREEVAWLLHQLCEHMAVNDPRMAGKVNRAIRPDLRMAPSRQSIQDRLAQLSRNGLEDESASALAVVASCLTRAPQLLDAAQAMERLAPSALARSYIRIHLTNAGELSAAERLAAQIERLPGTQRIRVSALYGLARIGHLRGDSETSMRRYRETFISAGTISGMPSEWLLQALICLDKQNSLDALSAYEEAIATLGTPLDQEVISLRAFARREGIVVDSHFARSVAHKAGPTGSRIIDEAFL